MERAVPYTVVGLAVGIALGFAAAWGLLPFLLVLIFGAVGLGVGRFLDGQLDVSGVAGAFSRRRDQR